MKNKPKVIAHRGSSLRAPENTIAAFELALNEGADGIEFDVMRCGSGELVVIHDQELQRVTGQEGHVESVDLKSLKNLDAGAWKDNRFKGEKIPTLSEALEAVRNFNLINIEIKSHTYQSYGIEKQVLQLIHQKKLENQVLISSFNPLVLWRLKRMNANLKRGLLMYEGASRPLRRGWLSPYLKPFSLHPSMPLLNPSMVKRAHKKGQKIYSWTVNHEAQLETCMKLGIDGMITDDPAWLIRRLKESHQT